MVDSALVKSTIQASHRLSAQLRAAKRVTLS